MIKKQYYKYPKTDKQLTIQEATQTLIDVCKYVENKGFSEHKEADRASGIAQGLIALKFKNGAVLKSAEFQNAKEKFVLLEKIVNELDTIHQLYISDMDDYTEYGSESHKENFLKRAYSSKDGYTIDLFVSDVTPVYGWYDRKIKGKKNEQTKEFAFGCLLELNKENIVQKDVDEFNSYAADITKIITKK
ncbi:MAG TPA: hypothetical protein VEC16_05970 [Alphaproteobacteria bacterium]|nr:hypothetical protein [Alphaproteobacteria bacterium]